MIHISAGIADTAHNRDFVTAEEAQNTGAHVKANFRRVRERSDIPEYTAEIGRRGDILVGWQASVNENSSMEVSQGISRTSGTRAIQVDLVVEDHIDAEHAGVLAAVVAIDIAKHEGFENVDLNMSNIQVNQKDLDQIFVEHALKASKDFTALDALIELDSITKTQQQQQLQR